MNVLPSVIGDGGVEVTYDAEACTGATNTIVSAFGIGLAAWCIGFTQGAGTRE